MNVGFRSYPLQILGFSVSLPQALTCVRGLALALRSASLFAVCSPSAFCFWHAVCSPFLGFRILFSRLPSSPLPPSKPFCSACFKCFAHLTLLKHLQWDHLQPLPPSKHFTLAIFRCLVLRVAILTFCNFTAIVFRIALSDPHLSNCYCRPRYLL